MVNKPNFSSLSNFRSSTLLAIADIEDVQEEESSKILPNEQIETLLSNLDQG